MSAEQGGENQTPDAMPYLKECTRRKNMKLKK
jgi:hypothetical protein